MSALERMWKEKSASLTHTHTHTHSLTHTLSHSLTHSLPHTQPPLHHIYRYVTGSVEVAPSLGLADAVVDLVETGTTMRAAGLEDVGEVMKTQTVLIANPHSTHDRMISTIHKRIKGYITATQHSMITYNCPKDKIEEASKITPGHDSPTITLLHNEQYVSVTSLVRTKEVPSLMDRLQDIGAQSIVSIPITNCRF